MIECALFHISNWSAFVGEVVGYLSSFMYHCQVEAESNVGVPAVRKTQLPFVFMHTGNSYRVCPFLAKLQEEHMFSFDLDLITQRQSPHWGHFPVCHSTMCVLWSPHSCALSSQSRIPKSQLLVYSSAVGSKPSFSGVLSTPPDPHHREYHCSSLAAAGKGLSSIRIFSIYLRRQ